MKSSRNEFFEQVVLRGMRLHDSHVHMWHRHLDEQNKRAKTTRACQQRTAKRLYKQGRLPPFMFT